MEPVTTAALVGAGAGVLGNIFNLAGQSQYNTANMELAQYQYEKNLEMWHRQNEYNLPINQIARLRQAGLNPVLAMSNGQTQNVSAPPPQYNKPELTPYQVDSSGLAGIGQTIMEAKYREKQMQLMENQIQLTAAKQATELLKAVTENWKGVNLFNKNSYLMDAYPIMLKALGANLDLMGARKEQVESSTQLTQEEIKQMPMRLAYLKAEIRNMDARTRSEVLRAAGLSLSNKILEIQSRYADESEFSKVNYLREVAAGAQKINDLRDLEKVLKLLEVEWLPVEKRAALLKQVIDMTNGIMKFSTFIP